eukprot:6306191-Pyramimonas_sp.AAC.2
MAGKTPHRRELLPHPQRAPHPHRGASRHGHLAARRARQRKAPRRCQDATCRCTLHAETHARFHFRKPKNSRCGGQANPGRSGSYAAPTPCPWSTPQHRFDTALRNTRLRRSWTTRRRLPRPQTRGGTCCPTPPEHSPGPPRRAAHSLMHEQPAQTSHQQTRPHRQQARNATPQTTPPCRPSEEQAPTEEKTEAPGETAHTAGLDDTSDASACMTCPTAATRQRTADSVATERRRHASTACN